MHKNYEHTYIWATKAKMVAPNEMLKRKMGNIPLLMSISPPFSYLKIENTSICKQVNEYH